jgi:hypothetical protein
MGKKAKLKTMEDEILDRLDALESYTERLDYAICPRVAELEARLVALEKGDLTARMARLEANMVELLETGAMTVSAVAMLVHDTEELEAELAELQVGTVPAGTGGNGAGLISDLSNLVAKYS